jgi:hypothetical protein
MISSFYPSWKQTVFGLSVIVEDILGKQYFSPSWKWTYFSSFSCLISTSYKILCTIGDAIIGSYSKECISKFKLDAEDKLTKVFLMRIFTPFHVLGNSSDSHKCFHQGNALFIKVLATFLGFLLWETKWSVPWFDFDESLTWRGLNLNPGHIGFYLYLCFGWRIMFACLVVCKW